MGFTITYRNPPLAIRSAWRGDYSSPGGAVYVDPLVR
jgi:hypothetical protein